MLLGDLIITETPTQAIIPKPTSRILPSHAFSSSSTALTTTQKHSINTDAFTQLTRYLFTLTPSEIDIEFRGLLPPSAIGNAEQIILSTPQYASIHTLMHYFIHALRENTAFEVIQAYIYRFLLIYSATMMETLSWKEVIGTLRDEVSASQSRLQLVIQMTLSVLKTILNMPTS
jgi:hypothetical protein